MMIIMNNMPLEKGHELEKKIEKFFQLHEYQTKRNVFLEGKSGGNHELDILAEKSDGIQKFKTIVECKAWNKPIEKDVVSKVAYVVRDLGLNKAIIVSLNGWRTGAEKSAKELGIELWGKDEIEKKLGKVSIAELETIEFKKVITGVPFCVKEYDVKPLIENESKGFLLFGKEEIKWIKSSWLPCYVFEISCSKTEGLIKRNLKTKKIWNLYEALTGSALFYFEDRPSLGEVKAEIIIQPLIKDVKIKNKITEAFEKYMKVVTHKANARYEHKLTALGIPLSTENLNVDSVLEMFFPVYIALLTKGDNERIIAIDGTNGKINKAIGDVLTANISFVVESFKSKS